jgi:hypothetical protein
MIQIEHGNTLTFYQILVDVHYIGYCVVAI